MKITVARFIFIEKPLFFTSAPKKKRVSKRKWMSGEIDACGDVHIGELFSDISLFDTFSLFNQLFHTDMVIFLKPTSEIALE